MIDCEVKCGLRYFDQYGEWRVMAVCEGYHMVRRKGCIPAVFKVKDLVNAVNNNSLSLFSTSGPSPRTQEPTPAQRGQEDNDITQ